MIKLDDKEIRIALTLEEAMTMQHALTFLGRHARKGTMNEEESEFFRQSWTDYVEHILPLYTSMNKQILQHEEDFQEENA